MSSASPQSQPNDYGLRIGHLNVYHLRDKVPDVCSFLNMSPHSHLFGLSETRLGYRVHDESMAISNYSILGRDAVRQGETGLALYVHHSIREYTSRRADLESQHIES